MPVLSKIISQLEEIFQETNDSRLADVLDELYNAEEEDSQPEGDFMEWLKLVQYFRSLQGSMTCEEYQEKTNLFPHRKKSKASVIKRLPPPGFIHQDLDYDL